MHLAFFMLSTQQKEKLSDSYGRDVKAALAERHQNKYFGFTSNFTAPSFIWQCINVGTEITLNYVHLYFFCDVHKQNQNVSSQKTTFGLCIGYFIK